MLLVHDVSRTSAGPGVPSIAITPSAASVPAAVDALMRGIGFLFRMPQPIQSKY
jgi:hypothetical protein